VAKNPYSGSRLHGFMKLASCHVSRDTETPCLRLVSDSFIENGLAAILGKTVERT